MLPIPRPGSHWTLLAIPLLFLTVCFVVPNMLLLSTSFLLYEGQMPTSKLTLENYAFFFSKPGYVEALLRTFAVGLAVGVIDVVLAFPIAYFLVHSAGRRWGGILLGLAMAPLLASVVVRTYGWYVILDRQGVLNALLGGIGVGPIQFMPSVGAIIVGLAHALLPYAVITIMGSLKAIDPSLQRAAMSLGATRFGVFRTVLLPLTLPGITSGLLLSFSIAISAYATPAVLGGPGTATLATLMYTFMMSILDWAVGSAIGVILLISSMGIIVLSTWYGQKRETL